MNNYTLANELITRCAGIPSPFRSMIQEAARRLLQMVPDYPVKAGASEAKSLRWLANMWPLIEEPQDDADRMSTTIHLYCTAAADRIEQMAETIAFSREIQAERDSLKVEKLNLTAMVEQLEKARVERDAVFEYLKNGHLGNGCTFCKHYFTESDKDPCKPCMAGRGKPNWEWRGAKPWKD